MIDVTTIKTVEDLAKHPPAGVLEMANALRKAKGQAAVKQITNENAFKLLTEARQEGDGKGKDKKPAKSKEPRPPSYQEKMRQFFDAQGFGTKDQLMKVTGADAKNLSVAVSILKNPSRCKDTRDVKYERKSQSYYCFSGPGAAKGKAAHDKFVAEQTKLAEAKAAEKKKKAAAKKQAEKAA